MNKAHRGWRGTKVQGWGPEVPRICRAGACASSLRSAPHCFPHFPVASLHLPLILSSVLWAYPDDCPGWLCLSCHPASRLMLPPPGTHLLPSPSLSLSCPDSSCCLQESHQALPSSWELSSLPQLHFAFVASFPLYFSPLYRCPIWQLIYLHIYSRYGEQGQPIVMYVAQVSANKTLNAFLLNEWLTVPYLRVPGTSTSTFSECLLQALLHAGRPKDTQAG